jgi:hypothetical protein
VHIPKFRYGVGKILANASTPDFSDVSDKILGYALSENGRIGINVNLDRGYALGLHEWFDHGGNEKKNDRAAARILGIDA